MSSRDRQAWLADREAIIVVQDRDAEERVRAAIAEVQRRGGAGTQLPGKAAYLAYVAQLQGRENLLPAERAAMARAAAEELQSEASPEPRIVHAGRAYEERLARRSEWQRRAGSEGDRLVEPDVAQRAYVVAPAAPWSGWSYRDMTRALSVAATSHLISPVPDQGTATASAREAAVMRESMDADRRAARCERRRRWSSTRSSSAARTGRLGGVARPSATAPPSVPKGFRRTD